MRRTNRLTQAIVDKAMPKMVEKRSPDFSLFRAAVGVTGRDEYIKSKTSKGPVHTMMADGNGLYLNLSVGKNNTVNRSWLWRFNTGEQVQAKAPFGAASGRLRPRQRLMGLGSADTSTGGLSLAEARAKVLALRHAKLVDDIADPLAIKHGQRTEAAIVKAKAMTFADCAAAYVADHSSGWRSLKHSKQWLTSLEQHCADLMPLPVQAVDEAMVIKALRRLWTDGKVVTGQRVRGRIEHVLDWARVNKQRPENEANIARWKGHLQHVLAAAPDPRHMKACPWRELPAFMASLRKVEGIRARALEFMILTAGTRTGSVLRSTWREIDEENRLWLIPASHMKRNREHRIPLVDDAFAIIAGLDRNSPRLFPVGENAMRNVAGRIRDDIDPHGFRSSFADFAAFHGWNPHEVDEALGHQVGSKVSRAYRRTGDWLERRRIMLAQWAEFLRGQTATEVGNVVPLIAKVSA